MDVEEAWDLERGRVGQKVVALNPTTVVCFFLISLSLSLSLSPVTLMLVKPFSLLPAFSDHGSVSEF